MTKETAIRAAKIIARTYKIPPKIIQVNADDYAALISNTDLMHSLGQLGNRLKIMLTEEYLEHLFSSLKKSCIRRKREFGNQEELCRIGDPIGYFETVTIKNRH